MAVFGIMDVTKSAAIAPFKHGMSLAASIGVMLLMYSVMVGVMALFVSGVSMGDLTSDDPMAMAESIASVMGQAWLPFTVMILLMLLVTAGLFNHWVRVAALGKGNGGFDSFGDFLKAAFVNGMKFLGVAVIIGVCIMILSLVITMLFMTIGVLSIDPEAMSDPTNLNAGMIGMQILMVAGICFVYALISSSLTKTALADNHVDVSDNKVQDFAAVLIMIYVPVVILSAILPTVLGLLVGFVVSTIVSFWSTFAIAAAHGYRHRRCVEMDAVATESL